MEAVTEVFIKYLEVIVQREGSGKYKVIVMMEVGEMSFLTNESEV